MSIYIWIVYSFIVLLAFVPFFRIDLYLKNDRYKPFLYVNIALVIWTFIIGIRLIAVEPYIIYYLSLLIYPLVMLSVVLLFLAVRRYLEKTISKPLQTILFSLVAIDCIMSMTNNYHKLFIDLSYGSTITLDAFNQVRVNIGYIVHSMISYVIILFAFSMLIIKFTKSISKSKDYLPIVFLVLSVLLGFTVNLVHVFIYTFRLDPTLIAFYILLYTLYVVFIIRDVKLLLLFDHNDYILDHYREMYLIVDSNGFVVDASDAFIEKFNLNIESNLLYKDLIQQISEKAYIYKDAKDIESNVTNEKLFLHVKENRVKFHSTKYYGRLFLFYDETQMRSLMNKLNYVMYHDLMTDMYNRNYFELVKKEYDSSDKPCGVILFDLDGLKIFNDFLGHKAGDDLLIKFSSALWSIKEKSAKTITPIRLGGDEFLMILDDVTEEELLDTIKQIKDVTFDENIEENIGFSYGYSMREKTDQKMTKIVKQADEKMYNMKKTRRNEKEKLISYFNENNENY